MEINTNECPYYLNDFLFQMRVVKGRAERTIEAYYTDLHMFLRYLKRKNCNLPADVDFRTITISDIPLDFLKTLMLNDIYEYLYFASEERLNCAATRARKASSIKGFYHYLTVNARLLEKNPAENLELPSLKKSLPKFLSLEESKKMLMEVDGSFLARDYCILTLFLNCGMRLSELVGLNNHDINFEERRLRLLGKGNKERIVYINEACISALKSYLSERKASEKEPKALFLSKDGNRISRRRVQQIVESSLKSAGLDGIGLSTHKLRHTAATLMYQYGNVDTLVLKEILGHKSIATTEIYTHVSSEKMKNAADASPLSDVKIVKK